MNQAGIYQIRNTINGNIYIGSAVNLNRRKNRHFNNLRKGDHENSHLQNAYNKYGKDCFEFSIIEIIDSVNDLEKIEQQYITNFNPEYNIAKNVTSPMLGRNHTTEAKEKIRIAGTGRLHTVDAKQKISIANFGKKRTIGVRKKMSMAKKGKPLSDETKEKIRIANTGKTVSEETRMKLSKAGTGKRYSEERIAKSAKAKQVKVDKINPATDEIIETYESVTLAALSVGVAISTLSVALKINTRTAGGYKWRYHEHNS